MQAGLKGVRLRRDGIAIARSPTAEAYGGRLTGLDELRNDAGEGLFSAQAAAGRAEAGLLLPTRCDRRPGGHLGQPEHTANPFDAIGLGTGGVGHHAVRSG